MLKSKLLYKVGFDKNRGRGHLVRDETLTWEVGSVYTSSSVSKGLGPTKAEPGGGLLSGARPGGTRPPHPRSLLHRGSPSPPSQPMFLNILTFSREVFDGIFLYEKLGTWLHLRDRLENEDFSWILHQALRASHGG